MKYHCDIITATVTNPEKDICKLLSHMIGEIIADCMGLCNM